MRRYRYKATTESTAKDTAAATVQRKLNVGDSDSPLEREADSTANMVMRMPESTDIQRKSSCSNCDHDDEHVHLKPLSGNVSPFIQTKSDGAGVTGNQVSNGIKSTQGGGDAMGGPAKSFMESRFGADFSDVRIHTGGYAGQLSKDLNAQAFTVGNDIYFNAGKYRPDASDGRRLLAHELTHVLQQSKSVSRKIQRKGNDGIMGDYALTMKWDIEFQQDKPSELEMGADPASVLTSGGLNSLNLVMSSFRSNPALVGELEGNSSVEGTPEYNSALSVRRAHYIAGQIGWGRVRDVPGQPNSCPKDPDGLYACGAAKANKTITPADRHVRVAMFTPPAVTRPSFQNAYVPPPVSGSNKQGPAPAGTGAKVIPEVEDNSTKAGNQWNFQAGIGGVGHVYLTTPGPSDPAGEAVVQLAAAFNHQFASKTPNHFELQGLAQLQISLTNGGVVSLAGGGQLSYVIPINHERWQWSAFVQGLIGSPLTSPYDFQFQPSIGSQIVLTPSMKKKWLQLGAQGSAGFTLQTAGPTSFDAGGQLFIQFVK